MPLRRTGALLLMLLPGIAACHHDSGKKASQAAPKEQAATGGQCASSADCATGKPCVRARCVDGTCRSAFAAAGTSCDNGDVCDGIARCDSNGVCRPGPPPDVDDHNACTVDSCDPVKGAVHTPVDVDDHDACTTDSCDPATGITHTPVDIDDGDDCTFDSCDPQTGVVHKKPEPVYTCNAGCGSGYHPVSRSPSGQCGGALQTFCEPDCGASFYTCGSCPPRYHTVSRSPGTRCGDEHALYAFCQKDDAAGFYTCDQSCPQGYGKTASAPSSHCGPDTTTMIRCVGAQ